jgi:hypothetical protein
VPGSQTTHARVHEHAATEQLIGDYLYVRRARTTMEKMISVVNRLHIAAGEKGTLTMTGSSGGAIDLTPIGPALFRRADNRGVVAFDAPIENGQARLAVMLTDSGFPAVYERIPLFATLRAQLLWILGMALVFVYAAVWRPLAVMVHKTRAAGWDSRRWSAWLSGIACALNLLFLVGFPLAFVGRLEGGVPQFLYGVPVVAARLLVIPPITAILGAAASIVVVRIWRDGRTSLTARLEHSVVAIALLSFIVFAWYWRLMP